MIKKQMNFDFSLIFNSVMLGVGLAMDAFSVSLADGMNEPKMKKGKMCGVSGVFALFQSIMPMIGWICVSTFAQHFKAFEKAIPIIAFLLLGYIGGSMIYEGIKNKNDNENEKAVGLKAILLQGIATSIDALSVGFTISDYNLPQALLSCLMIGVVTFIICLVGLFIGKKAGTKLAGKASILGGIILIFIGLKVLIAG